MKLPDCFLWYFLFAAILLFFGIACVVVETALVKPGVIPLDHKTLQARADYHEETVMPFMAGVFPKLLFLNSGVALFIMIVPVFWVWVWWFRRDLAGLMITLMQATVCLLMWALGHNSFAKIYVTYRQLSGSMIATMYLPHGVLEMLAFILAGTFAFLCIDALKIYLKENGNSQLLHPGDVCLFILERAWKPGLVIFMMMAVAAAIECWVTPVLVKLAFEAALQQV